ncbi:hypothetical protein MNBD_DELTA02-1118 [hydrothermal vent metagenome]|uniref:TolA protein n=1 Tax=hydrothermal vent metagenome TaxID=652676 RepID=A0A3B0VDZ3_9ZZZZ
MQSILNQQQPGLKKFITASAILHIIILFAGLFLIKAAPSRVLFAPTYTTVELVAPPSGRGRGSSKKGRRAAKRIAKKASPAKSAASAAKTDKSKKVIIKKKAAQRTKKAVPEKVVIPAAPKAKASPPVKEMDAVSAAIAALQQKATERAEDELIDKRIKELAEREKSEEAITRKLAGLREEILSSAVSVETLPNAANGAGSDVGPGTGTGARSSSLNVNQLDIAFIEYYNTIGSMIRSEWVFPGRAVPGLQATIAIKIAPDGKVLAQRVELASGNTLFDQSAVKAVEKVGSFPPLPKDFKEEFLEIGIRFCPGGCKQL